MFFFVFFEAGSRLNFLISMPIAVRTFSPGPPASLKGGQL